jgi:hypothetical protein
MDDREILSLWNAGKTSSMLAKMAGVSRSAIIGRITRLRNKGYNVRRQAAHAPRRSISCEGKPELLTLRENDCRYITGQNAHGAVYCKQPKHYKSYCEEHAELCYVTARQYGIAVRHGRNAAGNTA